MIWILRWKGECTVALWYYSTSHIPLIFYFASLPLPIRLDGLADELEDIAAAQGTSANKILELVDDNETIINEMKANLRKTVAAAMARVVMRSDGEPNGTH